MRSSSKSSLLAIALFIGATLQSAPIPAPIAGRQRVLWLGDSITQAGDYVTFAEYYLERAFPREKFDIISIGRSARRLRASEKSVAVSTPVCARPAGAGARSGKALRGHCLLRHE